LLRILKVLTFNTWLVRTPLGFDVSRDTDKRFAALPDALTATGADIIFLQEVWDPKMRAQISAEMSARGYPHAQGIKGPLVSSWFPLSFFHSHFGNGLLILSRFPIVHTLPDLVFKKYTRPDEILVMKGAIACEIEISHDCRFTACNAHLGAVSFSPATQTFHPRHAWNRFRQARALVKWLGKCKTDSPLFFAVDLNTHFRAWKKGKHSSDIAREVKLLLSTRVKKFGLLEASLDLGIHAPVPQWTFHHENTYVESGYFGHLPNEVPDYLFYAGERKWRAVKAERILTEKLSDHYGLLVTFSGDN
jgi:endonuclease/exonuclease/phosphatase family metal-dependent hydrolase